MQKIKELDNVMIYSKKKMRIDKITVLVTSDESGATLSLANETDDIMISIPMEAVKDIIKIVE